MPKKGQTWTEEQRAKIMAAKAKKEQEEQPAAPLPPRQRIPLQAILQKPSGSRWSMKAGNHRWEDATDDPADGAPSPLMIPKEMMPEGITLQWVTSEVYGKEETQRRASFEKTGWTPVHPEDFGGIFEGRWSPVGATGEINYYGLVLMAKPTEMVEKSRQREKQRARQPVQIQEQALFGGQLPGVMGADHASAKNFNHVKRTVERVPIPQDD